MTGEMARPRRVHPRIWLLAGTKNTRIEAPRRSLFGVCGRPSVTAIRAVGGAHVCRVGDEVRSLEAVGHG